MSGRPRRDPEEPRGSSARLHASDRPIPERPRQPAQGDPRDPRTPGTGIPGRGSGAPNAPFQLDAGENYAHDRRAQAERPPGLSDILLKFSHLSLRQFASCATFCANNKRIWEEDPDDLLRYARYLLRRDDKDADERAECAVQRYFMLTGRWHRRREQAEQESLEDLANSREFQDDFNQTVSNAFQSLRRSNDRRGQQETESLGGDLDTILSLAPNEVAPRRYIGPASDIGKQLPGEDRLEYENQFAQDYKLFYGRKALQQVFGLGCVFAVVWHETYGSRLPSRLKEKVTQAPPRPGRFGPGFLSQVQNGAWVYSHVKRFVVVKIRHGFSIALPVTSYSKKGLSEKNIPEIEKQAHTIVYSRGQQPTQLRGEPDFQKRPICIEITAPGEAISAASRLYYAAPQTIEHNIRVKPIGRVVQRHIDTLLQDYVTECAP